jgi:chitin synthase
LCLRLSRNVALWRKGVYDLTDYFSTLGLNLGDQYQFLNESVSDLFSQRIGQDITKPLEAALDAMDPTTRDRHVFCLNNVFYFGQQDFRKTARCQVQNYILLAVSIVLMVSIGLKCRPTFSCSMLSSILISIFSLGCITAGS